MIEIIVIVVVVFVLLVGLVGRRRFGRTSVHEVKGRSSTPTVSPPATPPVTAPQVATPPAVPAERPINQAPTAPAPPAPAPPAPALPAIPTERDEITAEDLEPEVVTAPRLFERLGRARSLFSGSLSAIGGRTKIDESVFDELEEALIVADVGLPTTRRLLDDLRDRRRSGAIADDPAALIEALRGDIADLFAGDDNALVIGPELPSVWLFVGVNGVGKTTTIGKLASREQHAGHKIVLAAGDTFRAAAGEQLGLWAERTGAGIVQGSDGADPSSVVFDAIAHAAARGADLVLADSAGRLHTKTNLMEELKKMRRVANRPPGHVTEVLLVIDATTGQNGLAQARQFAEAVDVTGIVLTKLDGTAKGGIVLAIRAELGLPIKLVGLGEAVGDLVAFDPEEFAAALVGNA